MHANQREEQILRLIDQKGFISFQELDAEFDASPATLRRDLGRLADQGKLDRMRGGVKKIRGTSADGGTSSADTGALSGVPFHENLGRNEEQKRAIGRAAAELCSAGEGVMIDGGSTTLQMCPHLAGLSLQVLTNSLHIVGALLSQPGTRILVPSGSVFREQNIILAAAGEESMPRFHAPKLFMGAASIGPHGLMQADIILVAAERRLIERADEVIVLVDSSKFNGPSGNVVCPLNEIDMIITDQGITAEQRALVTEANVKLIIVEAKRH